MRANGWFNRIKIMANLIPTIKKLTVLRVDSLKTNIKVVIFFKHAICLNTY